MNYLLWGNCQKPKEAPDIIKIEVDVHFCTPTFIYYLISSYLAITK